MTTPIDPGDTAALESAHYRGQSAWWPEHAPERNHHAAWLAGLSAVAYAVCPPDRVVVRRDDLRAVLAFLAADDSFGWTKEEADTADRLRALIGDE